MNNESYKNDLWLEIPGSIYIALGRRGQEVIKTDQCWIPGCDNKNKKDLEPLEKNTTKVDLNDGNYFTCTKIKVKCHKCGGTFKFAMKVIFAKPPEPNFNNNENIKPEPYMGQLFILDENDKNLGFAGYF